MAQPLILASTSQIRGQMLRQAGCEFAAVPARIDEETVRESLLAEGAPPRDIADTLAEMKARKVSDKTPGALVLGCDQVLDHRGELFSKPERLSLLGLTIAHALKFISTPPAEAE